MARSGELILDSLFNNAMIEGLIPSRIPKTRIGIFFAVMAAEIEGWEIVLDNFRDESFLSSAKLVQNIIKLAEPYYGIVDERASDVIVRFSWEDDFLDRRDTVIPFGQIIETDELDPIQFQTVERAVLYGNSTVAVVRARSVERGSHTMVNAGEITVINQPPGPGIVVTNPKASWGGRDVEPIESVRSNAMSARYSMTKATEDHFHIRLAELGLERYQYSIFDNAFGYGSVAVYIDSSINEQIREIRDALKEVKASGIYLTCESAERIYLQLGFKIRVVNDHDITPEERNNIKADIRSATTEFVLKNGVGNKIVVSRLIHYLYKILLEKYNFFDLQIINKDVPAEYLDKDGNITIAKNEVIKISKINIEIKTA